MTVEHGYRRLGKKRFLLIVVLAALFMTGCWDRFSIENRLFATAIAVDKGDTSRFTVSLAMPSAPKEQGQTGEANIKSASGETVTEALKALDADTGKKIYLGQAKVIILGQGLLSDAALLAEAADSLYAHEDVIHQPLVLAAGCRAVSVLKARPPDETLPGLYLAEYFKDRDKKGGCTFSLDFEKLYGKLRGGRWGIIPEVNVENNALKLSGSSAVWEGQLAGRLDRQETRGLLWARNGECQGAVLTLAHNEGMSSVRVKKHKVNPVFTAEDGRLYCLFEVDVTGETELPLKEDRERNALEADIAAFIEEEMKHTVGKMQVELHMDGYGLCDMLQRKEPELYKKYSSDWARIFVEMEILTDVTVMIE